MAQFDGTSSRTHPPSQTANRRWQFRRFIAQELRKSRVDLSDEGVEFDVEPVQQWKIFDQLKHGEIPYPRSEAELARLESVWMVRGRHREKSEQLVELLIADYGKAINRF